MPPRSRIGRIFTHLVILLFLVVQLDAFVYTMSHRHVGLFPWTVTRFFYALMAPYQGFKEWNEEVVAEGQRSDGTWEQIDLQRYYPTYTRGQRVTRQLLTTVEWQGARRGDPQLLTRRYAALAEQLRSRESASGRSYVSIRLWREDWPVSPDGYAALRLPAFTSRTLLVQAP